MLRPWRHRLGDEGFSLIEQVVALFIASLVFMALAGSAIAGVRASLTSRQNQQATDFMTRSLEGARLIGFGALGHNTSTVTSAMTGTTGCGPTRCFDPGAGSGPEPLVTMTSGSGITFQTTPVAAQANNTGYTVRTYVTQPAGQDPSLVRRATVVISWSTYGQAHTRRTSSLVALTQRGLPLPSFKLVPEGAQTDTVAPGATAVFAAQLTNQGATDSWNLAYAVTPAAMNVGTWRFFRDADGDNDYNPLVDTVQFADTNADGIPDTGTLTPTGRTTILVVRTLGASDPQGTATLTLTTSSISQPLAATASQSVAFTLVVSSVVTPPVTPPVVVGDCVAAAPATYAYPSGYSPKDFYLHNATELTPDTVASSPLVMNTATPYLISLGRYSTDVSPLPGRSLLTSSQADPVNEGDKKKYAEWQFAPSPNKARTINGKVRLHLWVNAVPLVPRQLNVAVVSRSSTGTVTGSSLHAVPVPASTCLGWQEVWLESTAVVNSLVVPKNGLTVVRVSTPSAAGLRLAYDAAAYPSTVTFAQQ